MDDGLAQRLLAANLDGLWLIGLDGSTLYANDRMCSLLGRTLDQLTPDTIFDLTDHQGRLDLDQHLAEMKAHHPGRENDEVLVLRPDGTQVWVLVSWGPVLDDDGALLGYLHRLTEHTERRELVDRLSQREAELESAQRIARLGSWTWDVLRDQVTWSPELYRIYGIAPEDFAASYEAFLSRTHPDERESVAATVEAVMNQGTEYEYEGRIITQQGAIRWIKARGVVDRDEHGAPVLLHGTCQDITDLRTVSNAATAANRRLRLLREMAEAANRSDSLDEGLTRAGRALDSVSEWRSLAVWVRGYTDDSWRMLHDLSRTGDSGGPNHEEAEKCWTTGRVVVADGNGTDAPRVSMPIQVQGRVICVAQLECDEGPPDAMTLDLFVQVAGQLGRVAERELAAVELAVARDDAMAASAHKSAFLATMSHEIRTPMNGVIGLTDLLLRTDLDHHQRRLAEGLRGAGLTLLALITDILDLSKIESGAVELEHAPFQVSEVLDQTATIITAPAQEKRLELVLSCDPAVPHTLLGDRVRLGQVLTNLASNAVKFTDQGEVVVELSLAEGAEPDRIMLRGEVRDTGIGTGGNAASLFEAFTQADRSTTRSHGGTGLGLTISRRLVQDMGGTIGTHDRPGGGSVFWFEVPLDRCDDAGPAPLAPLEPRRVLIVDDNAEAARALERQLVAWRLDVQVIGSAKQALPLLLARSGTTNPYELAFIDLHMFDGDGLLLGRALAAHGELDTLPTILLSDDPSARLEDATASGFRCIVNKPLRLTELHDAILAATLDTGELRLPGASSHPVSRLHEPLRLNVLVVEDNPVNQLVAQGLLEGLGCVSSVADNGEEAVRALAPGHGFDLVLMDCRMPRMDGYVATQRIRDREQDTRIPIIAMTASALEGERDRCLAVGMDDFITKPVDSATLTRVVTRWSAVKRTPLQEHPPPPTSTSPAVASPLVLDPERVAMLSELVRDGVNFFERTRSSFLSRIDATLRSLRAAGDEEDLDEVVAVAHQLKGSALNLGLAQAGAAAGEVETRASAHDLSATLTAIEALEAAVTEGVQALVAVSAADYAP